MSFRDKERAMYIYKARKEDKRTLSDIGRELGISPERTRQIYRKMDWQLNGLEADHHKKKKKSFFPPWLEVTKDPVTDTTVVIPKKE